MSDIDSLRDDVVDLAVGEPLSALVRQEAETAKDFLVEDELGVEPLDYVIPDDWWLRLVDLREASDSSFRVATLMIPLRMDVRGIARACGLKPATVRCIAFGHHVGIIDKGYHTPVIRKFFDGPDGWVEWCWKQIRYQSGVMVAAKVQASVIEPALKALADIVEWESKKKRASEKDKQFLMQILTASGILNTKELREGPKTNVQVNVGHVPVAPAFPQPAGVKALADIEGEARVLDG